MAEIEIRCPQCGKLLFKAQGLGTVVTCKCERCKSLVRWPSTTAEIAPKVERVNGLSVDSLKRLAPNPT